MRVTKRFAISEIIPEYVMILATASTDMMVMIVLDICFTVPVSACHIIRPLAFCTRLPMTAAIKMITPGVLIQLKETAPAPGEVLIFAVDLKTERKPLTGGTSLEVSRRKTKMRINGRLATASDMAGSLCFGAVPAAMPALMSYSAGTA